MVHGDDAYTESGAYHGVCGVTAGGEQGGADVGTYLGFGGDGAVGVCEGGGGGGCEGG